MRVCIYLTEEQTKVLGRIAEIEGATLEDEVLAATNDRIKWAKRALARVDRFHEEHLSYASGT